MTGMENAEGNILALHRVRHPPVGSALQYVDIMKSQNKCNIPVEDAYTTQLVEIETGLCLVTAEQQRGILKMDYKCEHCGYSFFMEEGYEPDLDKIICPMCKSEV